MKVFFERILLRKGWYHNQTITIENGVIVSIENGFVEGAKKVNGTALPGMINCHSHAFQRAFAGFSEIQHGQGDSFWSWREVMYKFLKQLTVEDIGVIASHLYIEMLKAGYTRVAEFHYLHFGQECEIDSSAEYMAQTIFESAKKAGIGLTLLPVLYQFSGFGSKQPLPNQNRFIHSTEEFNTLVTHCFAIAEKFENSNVGIAPHSLRAVNKSSLIKAVEHVRELDPKAPIHIHIAEQQKEVDDSLSYYGKRPVEWLCDNVELDEHWCLIHATHINEQEQKSIIESGAVAGICPTTEANLGDGVFPTDTFLAEGGHFAIGSDSHISVNPVEELRWLEYTQRLVNQQRAVLATPEQPSVGRYLWEEALTGGRNVTTEKVGFLDVGMQADIITLDSDKLNQYACTDDFVLDSLVFASKDNMIKHVMVNGRWVVDNGKHHAESDITSKFTALLASLSK